MYNVGHETEDTRHACTIQRQ